MSRDIFVEIPDLLRQLSEAIEQEEIPEEVAREISNGIRETLAKLEDHRNLIDPYKPDELVAGLRKYMLTMRKKLGEHELLARGSRASRHRE